MEPIEHDPTTFDVMPVGEQWEVIGSDGQTLCTMITDKAAIDFAMLAGMGKRPARVRLLTAEGTITQECDYPA